MTAKTSWAVLVHDMRISWFRLLTVLGLTLGGALSGCASHDTTLQSKIESDIHNPDSGNVQLTPNHFNSFAQDFESEWPFGPQSSGQ